MRHMKHACAKGIGNSIMMIRLLIALLLFAAVPVMAAEDQTPTAPALAQQQVRDALLEQLQTQAREAEARAGEAERRERDAELERLADQVRQAQARAGEEAQLKLAAQRELSIQEAKAELQNNAYSRLEIMLGAFGILITIIVLIITLRTEKAAVASAIDAGRKGIEKIQKYAKEAVAEIEKKSQEAEAHLIRIRENTTKSDEMRQAYEQSYASAPPSFSNEEPKSEVDRKTVADAAKEALIKPPRDRTAKEFRAIIIDLFTQEKWADMLTAAQQMRLLHEGDDDFGFALFNEAFALGQRERLEAIAAWDEVIAHYENSTALGAQEMVVSALVNKGSALGRLGRPMDSIAVSDEVIKRYGTNDMPGLQRLVAFARVNKGAAFGQLGRPEDEIAVCDDLIAHNDPNKRPEMRDVVELAYFNKARAYARQGMVVETITILQSMLGAGYLLNHQQIANVPDFDSIRKHPDFKKFQDEYKGG